MTVKTTSSKATDAVGKPKLTVIKGRTGGDDAGLGGDWLWNSTDARAVGVARFASEQKEIERTPGYRRLLAAVSDAVSGEPFWGQRYALHSTSGTWLEPVLSGMAKNFSHPFWCPALMVILGRSTYDRIPTVLSGLSTSLRNVLSHGNPEKLGGFLGSLAEEVVAEITLLAVNWTGPVIAQAATEHSVLGASSADEVIQHSMYPAGAYVPPGPFRLRYSWHDKWSSAQVDELFDDEEGPFPDLHFYRAKNLSDPALEQFFNEASPLLSDEDVAIGNFRPMETPHYRAELILVAAGTRKRPCACIAMSTAAVFEDVEIPRLEINVHAVVLAPSVHKAPWGRRLLANLGEAIGHEVRGLAECEAGKELPPRSPLDIHVTPEPGRSSWEPLLQRMKDTVEMDAEMELDMACLGSPLLQVNVLRRFPESDSAWPELGSVKLTPAQSKALERISKAARTMNQTLHRGGPLTLQIENDTLAVGLGYCEQDDVALGDQTFDQNPEADAASEFLQSPEVRRFVAAITKKSCRFDEYDGDLVLVLWAWSDVAVLMPGIYWRFELDWPLDEPVCELLGKQTADLKWREMRIEEFWQFFPEQLREVAMGEFLDY